MNRVPIYAHTKIVQMTHMEHSNWFIWTIKKIPGWGGGGYIGTVPPCPPLTKYVYGINLPIMIINIEYI